MPGAMETIVFLIILGGIASKLFSSEFEKETWKSLADLQFNDESSQNYAAISTHAASEAIREIAETGSLHAQELGMDLEWQTKFNSSSKTTVLEGTMLVFGTANNSSRKKSLSFIKDCYKVRLRWTITSEPDGSKTLVCGWLSEHESGNLLNNEERVLHHILDRIHVQLQKLSVHAQRGAYQNNQNAILDTPSFDSIASLFGTVKLPEKTYNVIKPGHFPISAFCNFIQQGGTFADPASKSIARWNGRCNLQLAAKGIIESHIQFTKYGNLDFQEKIAVRWMFVNQPASVTLEAVRWRYGKSSIQAKGF